MQHLHLRGLYVAAAMVALHLTHQAWGGRLPRQTISEIDFIDAVVPRNRAWALVQDLQRSPKHSTHASKPLVFAAYYYYPEVLTLKSSLTHSRGGTEVVFGTIYKWKTSAKSRNI